jgi:putative membrane protein
MKTIASLTVALVALAIPVAAAADPPPQDTNWLQTSISGDRFEIAGGKIALARSENATVKRYAQRLITDHSKSLHDALELAREWGMHGPPAATPSEQWELNRLKFVPRRAFDNQYISLEIKDHNQDIEETGLEARRGQAESVREEALKDLPMLNMHLKLGKQALNALEG